MQYVMQRIRPVCQPNVPAGIRPDSSNVGFETLGLWLLT